MGQALGIDSGCPLRVLADGAGWTWRAAAAAHLTEAAQVVDMFHARSTPPRRPSPCTARERPGRGRSRLLADGWHGLLDHVGATPAEGRTAAGQAALDEMIAYFAKHTQRLGY